MTQVGKIGFGFKSEGDLQTALHRGLLTQFEAKLSNSELEALTLVFFADLFCNYLFVE